MKASLASLVAIGVIMAKTASADVVLNEKVMNMVSTAAELSTLAYEVDPPPGDEFQTFGFFDKEPDQALVASKDGYCYGAFRGTTLTWIDWQQNFNPGKQDLCVTNNATGTTNCCTTRDGFYGGYVTVYHEKFEKAIRKCAKHCSSPDECIILTGHSQGGAIAAVAALFLQDLNPYVITFGQPPTIDAPCDLITSSRWYRFINTKESEAIGITYDPVPFVPGLGADAFGHMILLSNDTSGVAYIGLDAQDVFGPLNVAGFEAHMMVSTTAYPGYLDRIHALTGNTTNTSYPIRTSGYVAGSLCSVGKECESHKCDAETHYSFNRCVGLQCTKDTDCLTGRCDDGLCIPKLGSCMRCDEDSDCAGERCHLFHCSGSSNGLMDDNCYCQGDIDCLSGRCEGLAPPICEAQLALGAHCNEDSDCLSGHCGWDFVCGDKAQVKPAANATVEEPTTTTTTARSTNKEIVEPSGMSFWILLVIILVILIAIVLIIALAYYGGKKFLLWYNGYEEVPTTMDV